MTRREVKSLIERQTKSLNSYKTRVNIQNDLIREQQERIEALEKENETLKHKEKPKADRVKLVENEKPSPFAKVTDKRAVNVEMKEESEPMSYSDKKRFLIGCIYLVIAMIIVSVMAIKPQVIPSTHAWLQNMRDGIHPSFMSIFVLSVSLATCCAFLPFFKMWAGVLIEVLIVYGIAWDREVPWMVGLFILFAFAMCTGFRLVLPAALPFLKQYEFFRLDIDEKEVAKK